MMNERTRIKKKKNKLRTFRKFKLTRDYENYVIFVVTGKFKFPNINHRVAITKLSSLMKCIAYRSRSKERAVQYAKKGN